MSHNGLIYYEQKFNDSVCLETILIVYSYMYTLLVKKIANYVKLIYFLLYSESKRVNLYLITFKLNKKK